MNNKKDEDFYEWITKDRSEVRFNKLQDVHKRVTLRKINEKKYNERISRSRSISLYQTRRKESLKTIEPHLDTVCIYYNFY